MPTGSVVLSRLVPDSTATIGAAAANFTDEAINGVQFYSDAVTYGLPTGTPKATHAGGRLHSYVDVFYYHIFILPATIDFENVVDTTTREVIVWNAFFDAKTLSAITPFSVDGISINAVPSVFNALQAKTYTVTADVDGAPLVDGRFDFVFDVGTFDLHIIAQRVVPFMYPHDWAAEFKETISFAGEVLPSHRGARQQVINYRRKPWRKFEINHYVKNAHEAALLEAQLYNNQQRAFGVPVWSDKSRLLTAASTNDITLNIVTDYLDFNDGGLLVLYKSPTEYEIVGIDTVPAFADLVNLKQPLLNDWPANTRVYPMVIATLNPEVDAEFLTIRNARMRLNWVAQSNQWGTHRLDATEGLPTYRGYPVWLKLNDYGNAVQKKYARDAVRRGNEVNRFNQYELGVNAQHTTEFKSLLVGRQAIARYLDFVAKRRGRQVPFWFCSRSRDMELAQTTTATDARIVVSDWGYKRYYNVNDARRDIAIIRPNGQVIMRRITDILSPPDTPAGTLSLGLDATVSATIDADEMPYVRISFLRASRVEMDDVEIAFVTDNKVTSSLMIKDLQHSL